MTRKRRIRPGDELTKGRNVQLSSMTINGLGVVQPRKKITLYSTFVGVLYALRTMKNQFCCKMLHVIKHF